ncbi:MAG: hypothetical protein K0Q68_2151 [Moraxellaceae bacterium]|nr:hypothetical protein [Moraxellaceae bacterium]
MKKPLILSFILIVVVAIAVSSHSAFVKKTKDIAYSYAPEYTPMSRQEILEIYPGYYWEGCSESYKRDYWGACRFDEMQHESSVAVVTLTEFARRAKFEEEYVNENAEYLEDLADMVFGAVLVVAALLFMRILYVERRSIVGAISAFISYLPISGIFARGRVKVAELEYRKISRLHESGLISSEEYERRKQILKKIIETNLS